MCLQSDREGLRFEQNQEPKGAACSGGRGVAWLMRSEYAIATDCRGLEAVRKLARDFHSQLLRDLECTDCSSLFSSLSRPPS